MALNEQLVRSLRAVRDSLDSDGVSLTSTRRALQAACNVERDAMIATYANRVTSEADRICRFVTSYGTVDTPSADCGSVGWDEISADTAPEKGRAVRSPRKHAERNGMLPDPNAYP